MLPRRITRYVAVACVCALTFIAPALATTHVYFQVDGNCNTIPGPGSPTTATLSPGLDITINACVATTSAAPLNAWQVIIDYTGATPSGLAYVDVPPTGGAGNSIFVNTVDADFPFTGPTQPVSYQEVPGGGDPRFAVIYGLPFGTGQDISDTGGNYMAEFVLHSDGTNGDFTLTYQQAPDASPNTGIFGPIGQSFDFGAVEFHSMIITVEVVCSPADPPNSPGVYADCVTAFGLVDGLDIDLQCTDVSCVPAGCVYAPKSPTTSCDDGDPSTQNDLCACGPLNAAVGGASCAGIGPGGDCNFNGVSDTCDIAAGDGEDCQPNGIPDECDIASGTSDDCTHNLIPDECEEDCQPNGIADVCDIQSGFSQDCNGNGISDECENPDPHELGCCCLADGSGSAFMSTEALCQGLPAGVWLGPCTTCPAQNATPIIEPSGEIFVHRIGPPVDCFPAPAPEGPCLPKTTFLDPWVSPASGEMCHQFGVTGSPSLPAGFFSANSDPFSGFVCLEGVPLGAPGFGDADTLIERTGDPFSRCVLPSGTPSTVPIQIAALSLVSTAPMTITENGGQNPTQWNVSVDLSSVPSPVGTLSAVKTHCNGGTYTNSLPVRPRFTFTLVGNPGKVRVLDTGVEGQPPIVLELTDPQPWVSDIDPMLGVTADPCTAFHPGIQQLNPITTCDCNSNAVSDKCDIEAGTSLDCNANGIPDSCDIANCPSGTPQCTDCNANQIPDQCDISSGLSQDIFLPNFIPDECESHCHFDANCSDYDTNSIRDDNCSRSSCSANACAGTDIVFADIGGAAGGCQPDGTADNNDAFHALNCFANSNFGQAGGYPCDNALVPMNADVGGPGLVCCPDGACDANDRFLALQAFAAGGGAAGPNLCGCPLQGLSHSCPAGNATGPIQPYQPRITDSATLMVVPSTRRAKAGGMVSVDVVIANAVKGLQGYQLHLGVSGGKRGALELVDVTIAERPDYVYRGLPYWEAFNVKTHQMMAGLDNGPVAAKANGYLATFTYRVSPDASGTFVIDVLEYEPSKRENRTFLFGPINEGMVELVSTTPAVVIVPK